jgi:hypothetical protein
MLPSRHCVWLSLLVVAREFKPVRFFVMMALAAFLVCGVTAFYTHRAAHGRTAEERSAYAIGLKAGEQTPAHAILPTDAELNMMAQKYFKEEGSGDWQVGTSRSKTVTRTGSRRHTAAESNVAGRSLWGRLHCLHWAPHFRHCASITKHFE